MWTTGRRLEGMWMKVSFLLCFYLRPRLCFIELLSEPLRHRCLSCGSGQTASSLLTCACHSAPPPSPSLSLTCTNSGQVLSISSVGREVGMAGKQRLEVIQTAQESFSLKLNICSQRLVRWRANGDLSFGSPQSGQAVHSDAQHCWAACRTCAHLFPRENVLKFDNGGWVRKCPNL